MSRGTHGKGRGQRKKVLVSPRLVVTRIELDGGKHEVDVLREENTLLARASSGSAAAISELLCSLAAKLLGQGELTPEETGFLADSLLEVAQDVSEYGWPFGYQPQRGRPRKLNARDTLRVGLEIDRIHRPGIYRREHPPLPLEEAYAHAEEQLHVSDSTVRRAYKTFVTRFPDGAPKGLFTEFLAQARKAAKAQLKKSQEAPVKK